MEDLVEQQILEFYASGQWQEILNEFTKNKFLPWIWPDIKSLDFIGRTVKNQNSSLLISVGCGSGLLEWLLKMATGIQVVGIEIDKNWWESKYSSGTFIPVLLVQDTKKGEFEIDTENSVLLFCYFNNLAAFLGYVSNFKGNCFLVIGPGRGRNVYSVPEPFHLPEDLSGKWELSDHQEIRSSKDFIAVYVRK